VRTPQVRLFEEDPSSCCYSEAYEINCTRFGREPDVPIAHFKRRLAAPDGTYAQVRVPFWWG
jgi:transformation/transcription domain-associated protein